MPRDESAAPDVITRSAFEAPWWLRGRHVQTLFPSSPLGRIPRPAFEREVLELPDGDHLALDWLRPKAAVADAPLLLLLHGLEGSSDSTYARQLTAAAAGRGWNAVVMHFRDCGGVQNRLQRRYHAGDTEDLRTVLAAVGSRDAGIAPQRIFVAGYSLGGNVLLKYLGETGDAAAIDAAAAISVPFDLQNSADTLNRGRSRFYRWWLLRNMRAAVVRKFTPDSAPFDWAAAMRARDFETFDDIVTAPLHGFGGKDEYYGTASCGQYLHGIRRPTLILNSLDDPFMSPEALPAPETLSRHVTLELSERGGHVGFVGGAVPWRPHYWLPQRIMSFLEEFQGTGSHRRHL